MKPIAALLACAVLLLGATPAPTPKPADPVFSCPAPGLPTALELKQVWKIIDMKPGSMPLDGSKEPQAVIMLVYQNGAAMILVVYNKDAIPIFVDLAPEDDSVQPLLSNQWITAAGDLRAMPEGPCTWRKGEPGPQPPKEKS